MTYSKSRFSDVFAECADLVAGAGFTEDEFGSVDTGGHFMLVAVSDENLEGCEAPSALIECFKAACDVEKLSYSMEVYVVVETTDQGFINTLVKSDLLSEARDDFFEPLREEREVKPATSLQNFREPLLDKDKFHLPAEAGEVVPEVSTYDADEAQEHI